VFSPKVTIFTILNPALGGVCMHKCMPDFKYVFKPTRNSSEHGIQNTEIGIEMIRKELNINSKVYLYKLFKICSHLFQY